MALTLSILSILTALVPFLVEYWQAKKDKRNALGQVEADELRDSMDRVDRRYPPAS
jgi:hypothetical protein